MSVTDTSLAEFGELRPRLQVLLDLYGAAGEAERLALKREFEELFLATAWHIARDLMDHGYEPVDTPPAPRRADCHLKLIDGADAA